MWRLWQRSTPSECSLLASSATSTPGWVSWVPCFCSKGGAEGFVLSPGTPPHRCWCSAPLLSAWLMRALPPIPGPGKATPAQGELRWQAVLFRVILKRIKLWHCSFTVTLGTGRGSDPYSVDLVWAGASFYSCTQISMGEASLTPVWHSLAERACSSGGMAVVGGLAGLSVRGGCAPELCALIP